MAKIKLPKPFGKMIQTMYSNEDYIISEAYLDELEFAQHINGVKGLRSYLGVDGNQTLCDCFCVIVKDNDTKEGIIIEDKNSRHQKNPFDAKRQLEITHELLNKKKKEVMYAIMSRLALIKPFVAKTDGRFKLKVVTNSVNGRMAQLNQTKIPILYY